MATLAPAPVRDLRPAIGWALSGLIILFLLMDAGMKIAAVRPVLDTMAAIGWPGDPGTARILGVLLLGITGLYAWPRTAPIGAMLLTAYLGGAVATHARIGSPLLTHTLFGVYLGVIAWAGLWLRDARVRAALR
jgi:hypothetical protein